MDTDDLSIPTYLGIIQEAEKFNRDLTLQFGVLASACDNDNDYLDQAEALIKDWLDVDNFKGLINVIFFGESVNEKAFRKTLNKILANIAEIRNTPMDQREFEVWS